MSPKTLFKPATKVILLCVVALALVAVAPWLRGITSNVVLDREVRWYILFQLRIPRTLQGFLVGSHLALSGLIVQGLCRNPLATPFTLGIASGGALGVAIVVVLGLSGSWWCFQGVQFGALVGAVLASGGALFLARKVNRRGDTTTIVLAGVVVSFFCSSGVVLTQYLVDLPSSYLITRWLMGDLQVVGYQELLPLAVFAVCMLFYFSRRATQLDILALGEHLAASRGVDSKVLEVRYLLVVSISTALVVALVGPIGFVGIIVPHLCRALNFNSHVHLVPVCSVVGGAFVVVCDCLGSFILGPIELPVGVITALLGGPFFLWVLIAGD